ncbi:MAG: tripartite tricarboxylate transporter substrate binding protein [Burkholderiaceae bacterium]|uniref:Bug family tripartite tricarboxylate transporter substrate binding protein n=1 Tax=Hydrogenophaga sp. TaxID=1904254 RepID=UPI0027282D1B|nr:tripartite tricarboxylate transporter substrate binding protein [Hydrogenophaga sp.]MDO8280472.1 tripartite tricarboxylate transporter substrate binding protein [Burkholderiaceae bacterium]MDO9031039.1 tripartite tricarboxylate transporter substrate binding protein [Hydrogenophaga sp.]
MTFARRTRAVVFAGVLAQCASLASAQGSAAPAYPNRPIQVLIGIGAGSTTDVLGRLAARRLSERLKQPVVVDNRPGAGGTIAAATVAASQPDGYTLLWASSSIPMFPHMYDNLKFDPVKGLAGAGGVAEGGLVMLTRTDAPWKTLGEMISYAKTKPKRTITYASGGIGSNAHVFAELFSQAVGLEFVNVPYKGSSAALTDVMAGQIDFVFDGPSTAIPQVEAGRVRALAFSNKTRSSLMPNVPTLHEAGVTGYSQRTWLAFFVRAGTPKAIVDRLSEEIQAFVSDPSFKQELAGAFHEPWKISGSDLSELVRKEADEWGARLKTIKVK